MLVTLTNIILNIFYYRMSKKVPVLFVYLSNLLNFAHFSFKTFCMMQRATRGAKKVKIFIIQTLTSVIDDF